MAVAAQESLGDRVRRLREERGLTQRALADAAGLTLSNLRQIEYGIIPDPRGSTLRKLAHAFGVTVDELIGGTSL